MNYKLIVSGNYFQFKSRWLPKQSKAAILKAKKTRKHNSLLKGLGVINPKEVLSFKRKDNLSRSRNQLKLLAHSNINEYSKFITLTTQTIYTINEFQSFVRLWLKQLKRDLGGVKLKYIGVYELQKRGAPHVHIICFNKEFIDWTKGLKHWRSIIGGLGSLRVEKVRPIKHINYLLYYLDQPCINELGRKSILRSVGLEAPKVYEDNIPPHLKNIFLNVEYSRIMGYPSSCDNVFENIFGYFTTNPNEKSFTFDHALDFLRISQTRINEFDKLKDQRSKHIKGATGGNAPTSP